MIVPTLYQQIARFDAGKEQQAIVSECREETQSMTSDQQQQQQSTGDSNPVTFTDVLRQLKQLFTA